MRRINTVPSSGHPAVISIRGLQDADLDSVTGGGLSEVVKLIEQMHREAVIKALWTAATGQGPVNPGSPGTGQGSYNPLNPT
jgi:hypothetical protein